jgi:hypothetical protein
MYSGVVGWEALGVVRGVNLIREGVAEILRIAAVGGIVGRFSWG